MKFKLFLYYTFTFIAWSVYFYLTIHAPRTPTSDTLNINPTMTTFLQFTIALPYLLIWLMGCYSVSKLSAYKQHMSDAEERSAFARVRTGIVWLVVGLVISAIAGAASSYVTFQKDLIATATIFSNYVQVLFPLVGFTQIFLGIKHLLPQGVPGRWRENILVTFLLIGLVGTAYVFLIFTNSTRLVSSVPGVPATYYLPDVILFLTIVVPVLITWALGFMTALIINDITLKNITNPLKTIQQFMHGLWFILFSSILLQALVSIGTQRLINLGLNVILILIYLFLLMLGVGYLLIAVSAKKLSLSPANE